ncbi:MAG: glycosyltransferase [Candidatus Omnitrophica bacterium]|nr:glycosyltransferase [Candidatus Omnitrophota bacterium]
MQDHLIPLVSVIMLSYNYADYLEQAVESVLAQTFQDFELIILDDGSKDRSLSILQDYAEKFPGRIRLLTHPDQGNKGIVRSYEYAISHARGKYLAFLEADDVWRMDNLEKKITFLNRVEQAGVVYSDYRPFGDFWGSLYWKIYAGLNRITTPALRPFVAFGVFLKRNPVASFSHFLMRRHLFTGIPPCEAGQKNFDWWILAHLSLRCRFLFIPEKLVFWRIHKKSTAYGRVNKRALWRFHQFLKSLYRSFEHVIGQKKGVLLTQKDYRDLSREKKHHQRVDDARRFFYPKTWITRPLDSLRFLVHIILKNCLLTES